MTQPADSKPEAQASPPPEPGQTRRQAAARRLAKARGHYLKGNRLFERQEWVRALAEWRVAETIWRGPRARARRIPFAGLWAATTFLLSVLAVYLLLFQVFLRDPAELETGSFEADTRSWWEQWLDSGRPNSPMSHKMDIGEWWRRMRHEQEALPPGLASKEEGQAIRPPVTEKWNELLRRYGRWGRVDPGQLDFKVVSGFGLANLGHHQEARQVLEDGIASATNPDLLSELYQGLANTYYYEGYRLQPDGLATYDLKLVAKAAEAYENSLRYKPRLISHGNLGWMYFLLGDYKKAEANSLLALRVDDSLDYVRLNLGMTYLAQKRYDDAFEAYSEVVRRQPDKEVLMGGINDLRELLRDNPGRHPFAHMMVGFLAIQAGDMPLARRHIQQFLAHPAPGAYWKRLAAQWLANPNQLLPERG